MSRANGGALAAAAALKANLRAAAATLPSGTKGYVRFLQDGNWVFGQDNVELEPDTEVALNPLTIKHGWSCWTDYDKKERKKNELVAEVLLPISEPLPARHTLKDTGWEWRTIMVVELKVMTGKHKDKELVYSTTSDGGLRARRAVIDQLVEQLDEDPENIVPVISLGSDHYTHKQWGKTYTPVLDVVAFANMDGIVAEDEPAEEAAPPARTRNTAPAKEEPVDEGDTAEPVKDEPVRRRRR
jgi:hypothetical protein